MAPTRDDSMGHTRDSSLGRTRVNSLGGNSIRHERFSSGNGRREFSGGTFFPGEYATVGNNDAELGLSLEDVRKNTMEAAESRYKVYGNLYKNYLDNKGADTSSELPPPQISTRKRKEPKPKRKKREHKPRRPKRKERTAKQGRFRRFISRVLRGNTKNMDTPKKDPKEKKMKKAKDISDEEEKDKNMAIQRRRTAEWVESVDMGDSDLAP